jgi:hypothetical protein
MIYNSEKETHLPQGSKAENFMKNIPFSYYNSQLTSECSISQQKNKISHEEKCLKDKIENQIKMKYNLIIPAILIEIQENGLGSVKLLKDDLQSVNKMIFT